jgi:hypothetical protein
MNRRKNNGHAEPQARPNGHAAASPEQGVVPAHANLAAPLGELAAPHDAAESSLANAAISAGAASAAQRTGPQAARFASPGTTTNSGEKDGQAVHFPGPTDSEAMQDAGAYVNAVAERVDLVAASVRLVQSGDQKVAKAELDRLRDMKFGKVGPAAVEEQMWPELGDLPRPPR